MWTSTRCVGGYSFKNTHARTPKAVAAAAAAKTHQGQSSCKVPGPVSDCPRLQAQVEGDEVVHVEAEHVFPMKRAHDRQPVIAQAITTIHFLQRDTDQQPSTVKHPISIGRVDWPWQGNEKPCKTRKNKKMHTPTVKATVKCTYVYRPS